MRAPSATALALSLLAAQGCTKQDVPPTWIEDSPGSDSPDPDSPELTDDSAWDSAVPVGQELLRFSAMADVPYEQADEVALEGHVSAHNAQSDSRFMVHLGDFKPHGTPCEESIYLRVAELLAPLTVPTFIVVGDNDWNDCPDPDRAWGYWTAHFERFEQRWASVPEVSHQAAWPANFAWVQSGVLFVGVTLPAGAVHDPELWEAFMGHDADWVEQQVAEHGADALAMVVLAHGSEEPKHSPFLDRFRAAAVGFGKPVLYLQGDGHAWDVDRPWEENILRVQLDDGGSAPPVQVRVYDGGRAFDFVREPFTE